MFGMYVNPQSTVTARSILKAAIKHYQLNQQQPSIDQAIIIADDLMQKHGLYVRPDYLLTVWQETIDNHDTLNQRRCHP